MRIEEAKARYSIREVAQRLGLVPVPRGRTLVCTCPFHEDHEPSMVLAEDGKYAGRYICRPCGQAEYAEGDMIDLVMRVMRFDHPMAAVRWLTGEHERAPIARPAESKVDYSKAPVINEDLSAYAWQAKVERTDAAAHYLRGRRLLGVADEFHIGSTDAPGFPTSVLPLYWHDEKNRTWSDKRFLNRLVIPYFQGGKVTHVNARALPGGDPKQPKYLKAQTPHKQAHMPPYLLDHVLEQGADDIVLCEGELDALSVYAACEDIFACAVPGVGALLDSHLEQFDGRRVWIIMDNDKAGQQARRDMERRLYPYARSVHQLVLPPRHTDVNSFLVADGRDYVAGYLEAAFRKAVRRTVSRPR